MKHLLLVTFLLAPALLRAEGQLDVEVILFRHLDADLSRWPSPREAGDYAELRSLDPSAEAADKSTGTAKEFPHWTVLPESMQRLGPVAKALAKAGAYEVVLHTAWRQPANARHRVRLQAGEPPVLDGSLQVLGAGKKMQVVEDLTLVLGDHPVRLQSTQQMRARELRYADHALLGLLIQATPVDSAEKPDAEAAAPAAAADGGSTGKTRDDSPVERPAQVGPAD